jgi:hypothetical protein
VFRIADPLTGLKDSWNTVTAGDAGTHTITFSATAADSFSDTCHIVLAGPAAEPGAIGGGGSFSAGTASLSLADAFTASLLKAGDLFRIAQGGPGGTPGASFNWVRSVSGNTVYFTASEDGSYGPGDHILVLTPYVFLPGAVNWEKSVPGNAAALVPGSFIPGLGRTAVFTAPVSGSGLGSGNYRIKDTETDLAGSGNGSLYPSNAGEAVAQCFERTNFDPANAYIDKLRKKFFDSDSGNLNPRLEHMLFEWQGGVLARRTLDYFLGRDNGGNHGDLRDGYTDAGFNPRINGVMDIGAYER